MKYLSVCSGIEAATQAWHSLGWEPVAFSEIEPFPCKLLAHHYPDVPNYGDMTKFKEWPDAAIDVLVGGTPCQSFSIAGLRKGLDDPRGNLMLTYLAIAAKYEPEFIVWENVPGVLSSNGGRDFAAFVEGLAQLGYGWAYRVLDAQYCRTHEFPHAVPQRRRRVFVVGCLGNTGRAAAVLFDSESLRGNPPPSRKTGQEVAGTISKCSFSGGAGGRPEGAAGGHFLPVARSILAKGNDSMAFDLDTYVMSTGQAGAEIGIGTTLNCNHEAPIACYPINDMATRHAGTNGSGAQTGKGHGLGIAGPEAPMFTLTKGDRHAVAYRTNAAGQVDAQDGISAALNTQTDPCAQIIYQSEMAVRRLTPTECERLQAFPDGYTNIPGASDSARYKALGNSMAVNVMQLIGERIDYVRSIT